VVKKVWVQGERKDFYSAEVQLWRMISRVLGERERAEVLHAIDAFEEALGALDRHPKPFDAKTRAKIELQKERVSQLLELSKLGKNLLETLVAAAKLDVSPLVRFVLGRRSDS